MKQKLFYLALSAMALSACTSEVKDVDQLQSNGIGFDKAVMKQSRAGDGAIVGDLTNDNLDKFLVYGYYTKENQTANPVQVFGGDAVTHNDDTGVWEYKNTRYWVPGATYHFFAYSCADIALDNIYGSVGLELNASQSDERQLIISNYRCDQKHNHDLVYAQVKNRKGIDISEDNPTPNANVAFNFEHILTKIDAKFETEFDKEYDVVIKDVRIVNFRNIANFAKTKGWTGQNRDFTDQASIEMQLEFDTTDKTGVVNSQYTDEQKPRTNSVYVIPHTYQSNDVQLRFTIELYKGKEHTPLNQVMSRNMEGHWKPNWQAGYYYTYNIKLAGETTNLQPIVFETAADMNLGWTTGTSTATDMSFSSN